MTTAFDTPSTMAVLGVEAGVGCTHTAIELARAAAVGSHTVLLVDADIRRPAIHDRLGLPLSPGLSDVLHGAGLVAHPLASAGEASTLSVLPAGGAPDDPVLALSKDLRPRVLEPAARQAALTIVDVPPIAEVVDAAVVAAQCDTTILVIAEDTPRRVVRHVVARLQQIGVIPLGIVINGGVRSPGIWGRVRRWLALPEAPMCRRVPQMARLLVRAPLPARSRPGVGLTVRRASTKSICGDRRATDDATTTSRRQRPLPDRSGQRGAAVRASSSRSCRSSRRSTGWSSSHPVSSFP